MSDFTTLLTSVVETERDSTPGFRSFNLSGEPYAAAAVGAVIANYSRFTGRPKPVLSDELIGEKVTLIIGGDNMLGGGTIIAREGRIFQGQRGLAILPKGKRSKGYSINEDSLLDVLPGWCTNVAEANVMAVRHCYPRLRNLTQARLEELPGEDEQDPTMCSLAVFGHNRVWGGADCLWLIGEYWPEDDICDRNVLLIRPEFGTSEHGSCYGRELLQNRALGEVVGFEPISFSDAIKLCEMDFDRAFDRVIASSMRVAA